MARSLEILTGISPNQSNGLFYVFSSFSSYLTYLRSKATYSTSVAMDNYRITRDEVRINEDVFPSVAHAYGASYMLEIETNDSTGGITYARAYNVVSATRLSGFYLYKVEVDLWASYYPFANISEIHVSRCNRDIANGRFDEVKTAFGDMLPLYFLGHSTTTLSEASIVFLLSYNISQSVFGNNQITKTSLFSLTLQRIYDEVHEWNANYDGIDIIDKAIDVLGGVYSAGATNAHVLRAWIVPTSTITDGDFGISALNTKCMMSDSNARTISNVNVVEPKNESVLIDYEALIGGKAALDGFMPAYHVEIGTPYNSMALQRFTRQGYRRAYFHYVYGNAELSVYVQEGDKQLDISRGFEVPMTMNNATETSLMRSARVLGTIGQGLMSISRGYASGGKVGAIMAGAGAALSAVGGISDAQANQSTGSGDGAVTFRYSASRVKYPYVLMMVQSNDRELTNEQYQIGRAHV